MKKVIVKIDEEFEERKEQAVINEAINRLQFIIDDDCLTDEQIKILYELIDGGFITPSNDGYSLSLHN